jgi:hypothetical protein
VDEAWFIGQHLEQYHHASRSPFDYYLRGVELDPQDYRCNLALAMLEYNRADYRKPSSMRPGRCRARIG